MSYTDLDNKLVASDIQEKLYQDKSFLEIAVNDDSLISARQRRVVIPQAGSLPEVAIDAKGPLTSASRTETFTQYDVHSYRTNPILIRDFEDYFTNYNKQDSVTREQALQLKDKVAAHCMHLWASGSTEKINSTGSERLSSFGGSTGNRKAFTFQDLLSVKKKLIKDGGTQSPGSYVAIINSEMYSDLMKLDEVKNGQYRSNHSLDNGSIGEFLGFTFFLREDLPTYNASNKNIKPFASTGGSSEVIGAIFYHKDLVRRAISPEVQVYLEVSASKAGVEISSEVWAGASLSRSDKKGFVILIEAK
ncbi:MAG: phage capsid protein [Cytophagales bacterium]|nr:phage capsid protein [Cytophagales bacterium]